jgi:hypothetical protein
MVKRLIATLLAGVLGQATLASVPVGSPEPEPEKSGCCSWHGGVCGCSGGRVTCCDGVTSPTCTC